MRSALFLKYLLRVILVLVILLIVSEILIRVAYHDKLRFYSSLNYQEDSLLGYRYKPGAKGEFRNIAYRRPYLINSLGFPGKEFNVNKKPGVFRIIVVGTSDDTGLCTDGPLNYVDLLDSSLKKNGFNAEVINCSIDGTGKGIRNIKLIKNECIRYEPDLILLEKQFPIVDRHRYRTSYKNIVINYADLEEDLNSARKFIDNEITFKDFRNHLFDYSYLFRLCAKYYLNNISDTTNKLAKWMEKPFFKEKNKIRGYFIKEIYWLTLVDRKYPIKKYTDEESIEIYKNLSDSLLSKKIRLVLFNKYESKNDPALIKRLDSSHIAFWPMQIPHKEEYSFGELDGHSSQEGHKAIAMALYKYLTDSAAIYGLNPKNLAKTALP